MSNRQEETKALNYSLQNCKLFQNRWNFIIKKSRREHDPKRTHLYDLLPTEVTGEVIFGENVKTIDGYVMLNLKLT